MGVENPRKNLLSRSRNNLEICSINLRNLGCVNGAYTHMASIHSYTPENAQKPWAIGYKTRQEWEKWPQSARHRKTTRDWMPVDRAKTTMSPGNCRSESPQIGDIGFERPAGVSIPRNCYLGAKTSKKNVLSYWPSWLFEQWLQNLWRSTVPRPSKTP